MNLNELLVPEIAKTIEELYGQTVEESLIQLQKTRKEFDGDITLVTFPFTKLAGKSPEDAGKEIGEKLCESVDLITGHNVVKGFLNLVISDKHWLSVLEGITKNPEFGRNQEKKGRMMVEYASPNTNKPLHLGHLRNIFLGYSVAQILEADGHEVEKTQIINDRGIHICKSMLAWQLYGNGETPDSAGMKGDKLVGKYYVEFDKAMREESSVIMQAWESGDFSDTPATIKDEVERFQEAMEGKDEKTQKGIKGKIKELANNQTRMMADAQDMLKKWEAKDPEVYQLWEKMNGWCYDGFDMTYATMGVDFDKLYYESNTFITGKQMVEEGLEKGIFFQKDDGSVWIDLSDEGLDEKLVLRADGTAVYITQDIGTATERMDDYPDLAGIVYTVGNEQDYHFKVLFLILEKLGYQWAKNCYHLSYGMVDLPSGKMKSREGTVVDADDIMAETIEEAKVMTQERGHIEGMSVEEKTQLYHTIGLGGLKYYLLKVDPKKRMMFNPEESIDLNGNTGPFIQYAHARICSLLRKADSVGSIDMNAELHESERELLKHLAAYPETVSEAAAEFSPALIANYTYDLAKLYNSFFQSISVFKEENIALRDMRLHLSESVGKVIKSSMGLLGIQVPERM